MPINAWLMLKKVVSINFSIINSSNRIAFSFSPNNALIEIIFLLYEGNKYTK